ncbi:MAG: tRNA pseudouridine(38-40) synthase TruA [Aquificaceae bacterium]
MLNYVLLLSFVGTNFHGWQIQPNLRTVQGTLKETLERILGEEIKLTGCCRTDAGVHAEEYIASFQSQKFFEDERLLIALNSILPEDIGIKKVWKQENFNARYSVEGKVYTYRVFNSHSKNALIEPFVWRVAYKFDFIKMQEVSKLFLGKRNFWAFTKEDENKSTTVEIQDINISKDEELIKISIRARNFLRHMVRRIVGCLVYFGLGKISMDDVNMYLCAKKRCPFTAKAKGLTLEKVLF